MYCIAATSMRPRLVPVAEAVDLRRARLAEIAQQRPGGLAGPFIAGLLRVAVGRLDQVERPVDEPGVLAKADVLIIREADIGVRVIAHVEPS